MDSSSADRFLSCREKSFLWREGVGMRGGNVKQMKCFLLEELTTIGINSDIYKCVKKTAFIKCSLIPGMSEEPRE